MQNWLHRLKIAINNDKWMQTGDLTKYINSEVTIQIND